MLSEKRHELILKLLEERGSLSVPDIKEVLNISESTIRRDLTLLDKEGKLTKVFGGAVWGSRGNGAKELSVSEKLHVNEAEKRMIAKYAAGLIEPHDFVYLDAGTTTGYMIDYISQKDATYVTNAVDHAKRLGYAGFRVILVGGELRGTTEAVVGGETVRTLSKYHFSKGFFGTNGISASYGYTTPDESEAVVKETAVKQCNHCYVLADDSKFDEVSNVTFAEFHDLEILTNRIPKSYSIHENVRDITEA